jgi:hypothetical protein
MGALISGGRQKAVFKFNQRRGNPSIAMLGCHRHQPIHHLRFIFRPGRQIIAQAFGQQGAWGSVGRSHDDPLSIDQNSSGH